MPTVEELRAQLRAMEEAERNAGKAEYKTACDAAKFEWRVVRPNPFQIRVECRYDPETVARFEAHAATFPKFCPPFGRHDRKLTDWHGMTYVFGYTRDGQAFLDGGGGSVILELQRNSFAPSPITREQAEMLESGIVPDELKKPW